MDDKELLKRLRQVFVQEAKERLTSMSTNLIAIENEEDKANHDPILEIIYRDAHSLKGAARSINLAGIESLFQVIESMFSEIRDGQLQLSNKLSDSLLEAIKAVGTVISSSGEIESDENNKCLFEFEAIFSDFLKTGMLSIDNIAPANDVFDEKIEDLGDIDGFEEEVDVVLTSANEPGTVVQQKETIKVEEPGKTVEKENSSKEPPPPNKKKTSKVDAKRKQKLNVNNNKTSTDTSDTIRIVADKLDSLLLKSENLILIKLIFREQHNLLLDIYSALEKAESRNKKIYNDYKIILNELRDTALFDKRKTRTSLNNIVDFLTEDKTLLANLNDKVSSLFNIEKENKRNAGNMIDEFLSDVKDLGMMPFSNILDVFPMMIRDIAKKLDKNVNFTISGDNIKVDRRILQEIKDPLIHLLRNAIDHGIENQEIRSKLNKPPSGKIDLSISQTKGGKIEIVIADDGKGVDTESIKNKLINEKILPKNEVEALMENEIIEYIFYSGFSTSQIVTELSGRGLGMAIVRNSIERLGGSINILNAGNGGTSVVLKLPVTMATYKGLIVKVNNEHFILPSTDVEKAITVKQHDIYTVENKPAITVDDQAYPLVNLHDLLEIKDDKKEEDQKDEVIAIIIGKTKNRIALKVDEIIEEQEILLKDLGKLLPSIRNITGATILNSGEIVTVLNVQDLMKSSKNIKYSHNNKNGGKKKEKKGQQKKKLLVVEDSITSRTLLKNILESAGYSVKTAIDGVAGYTELKSGPIDLVVLDVEMPRMNGFELTAKVRADKQLSDLPIVLVTSRSTRADREKGIDAGANAYIVKSNFDQNNLLEVVDSFL